MSDGAPIDSRLPDRWFRVGVYLLKGCHLMPVQRELDRLVDDVMQGRLGRRSFIKRATALGLSFPTIMALLAACGGDDDDDSSDASNETSAGSGDSESTEASGDSTEAEGDATEAEGDSTTSEGESTETEGDATEASGGDSGSSGEASGQIVIMQGVDANTLDPLLRNSTPEFNINLHVFDMFLKRDPSSLEILPNVVESWETVDDTTWEFKLVEGATFHNGDPVNAEAAVFTFERAGKDMIGEQGVVQSIATLIGYESAEAVDEYTFRVMTTKPAAIFPDLLTSFELVPPSVYEDESAENLSKVAQNPVGSGPYKFVEWVRDDHITLEINPDWWGEKPSIATVIFRPVPELSARVVALQNGEANIVVNIAPDLVEQVNSGDTTRVSNVTGGRIIFVGIRADKPPFDDVRVRQAISYAVDWEAIKNALLAGYGERAATMVNPPHVNDAVEPYPYDPEKAKALLKEAGVPEGFEVTMDAPSGRYIKDAELAQALAQGWNQIGLKVNLKVLEWGLYAGELLPSGEPDELFFLGLGAPFSGEQELFWVHPEYSLNFTRWQNQEYVDLFDELTNTIDPDKRQELMDQLQVLVREECPWVFLWHQVDFYGASKDLEWEARPDERIWAVEADFV